VRIKLTQQFIDRVGKSDSDGRGNGRTLYWDKALPGFGLCVTEKGAKSYVIKYGNIRMALNGGAALKLADARKEAMAILAAVAKGSDPLAERRAARAARDKAAESTLQAVCESYLAREGEGLRTADDRRKALERLVYPVLGQRPVGEIRRNDITGLLDKIEDTNGPRMSGLVLAYLRRVFNWHAARIEGFAPPIVKGMARASGAARVRARVLSEDEIRAFWRGAETWEKEAGELGHPFPRMLRFILLTAVRRDEAANATWSEIGKEEDDIWLIPAARNKTGVDFEVPLSRAAMAILSAARKARFGAGGFVFTTDGEAPISGFSKFKVRFDNYMRTQLREMAYWGRDAVVERWAIHDLRRTARSLMSPAGVDPDHAERALGHTIGGVRGVYDHHDFRDEKRAAFEALAARVDHILKTHRW
jgi:integrase